MPELCVHFMLSFRQICVSHVYIQIDVCLKASHFLTSQKHDLALGNLAKTMRSLSSLVLGMHLHLEKSLP